MTSRLQSSAHLNYLQHFGGRRADSLSVILHRRWRSCDVPCIGSSVETGWDGSESGQLSSKLYSSQGKGLGVLPDLRVEVGEDVE